MDVPATAVSNGVKRCDYGRWGMLRGASPCVPTLASLATMTTSQGGSLSSRPGTGRRAGVADGAETPGHRVLPSGRKRRV